MEGHWFSSFSVFNDTDHGGIICSEGAEIFLIAPLWFGANEKSEKSHVKLD